MGFFNWLWGSTKDFFSYVAKTAIGIAVEDIKDVALSIVQDMENRKGLDGQEKFKLAHDTLKQEYPDAQTTVLNLAIESAVAIVKDQTE